MKWTSLLLLALCGCATHAPATKPTKPPVAALPPMPPAPPLKSGRAIKQIAPRLQSVIAPQVVVQKGEGYIRVILVPPGSTATNFDNPPVPAPPHNALVLPGPRWFYHTNYVFPADPPFPEQHISEFQAMNIPAGRLEIQATVDSWPTFATISTIDWPGPDTTLVWDEETTFWPRRFFRLKAAVP